jgi:hypothetical protein
MGLKMDDDYALSDALSGINRTVRPDGSPLN